MKSFDTELTKYAEKIRLRAVERRELRERVLAYMEYHPLPKQANAVATQTRDGRIASEPFALVRFNTFYSRIAAGVFGILLIVAVPFAAERAVPGDALYPIKTLNEGIRAQFVNSPYEQVAFETELLERRISEARLLAQEGKLTAEVEAEIAETVKAHADAAQEGIAVLKTSDADEGVIAEIAFNSALDVQSAVLNSDMAKGTASSTDGIANAVRAARVNSEANKSTTTPSYEKLVARVESETTRAYELYESIKDSATDKERLDIERRLADIDRAVIGAQNLHESGVGSATDSLKNALALTQKLVSFMTDIDVRENVELNILVPVVLTDEEVRVAFEQRLNEVQTRLALLQDKATTVEDSAALEKIESGVTEAEKALTEAVNAFENGSVTTAQTALERSYNYVVDTMVLVDELAVPAEEPAEAPEQDAGTSTPPAATSTDDGTGTTTATTSPTTN